MGVGIIYNGILPISQSCCQGVSRSLDICRRGLCRHRKQTEGVVPFSQQFSVFRREIERHLSDTPKKRHRERTIRVVKCTYLVKSAAAYEGETGSIVPLESESLHSFLVLPGLSP